MVTLNTIIEDDCNAREGDTHVVTGAGSLMAKPGDTPLMSQSLQRDIKEPVRSIGVKHPGGCSMYPSDA